MRSVVQDHYGGDADAVLHIDEISRPTISAEEVLVRVEAASVDMGTWHLMTGMPYAMRLAGLGVRAPKAVNPGRAFAGTVAAIGAQVRGFAVGEHVYGSCGDSFAEYVAAQPASMARKPANLTFEQAAAVPISGGTALQALRKANVQPGEMVLVIGASGGVGTFAVQIAKAMGAEVTGVGSASKLDRVRALGADHVVDYLREDYLDGSRRYDVIVDIGGSNPLGRLRRALTPDGRLVIVGGETGGRWLGGFDRSLRAVVLSLVVRQRLGMLTSTEKTEHLDDLRPLIESGDVTPLIDRTYPLTEVAAAIDHVKAQLATGKVALAVQAVQA
jgi:NADPH:quinone reductase-like Zn-dependent oxidoreductase